MNGDVLDALRAARRASQCAVLVTDLTGGDQALWVGGTWVIGGVAVEATLDERVAESVRRDASATFESDGRRLFVRVFSPPRRAVIVGAVHIAQPLVAMLQALDYEVVLIDPRDAWATDARFPEVRIDRRWPAEALEALKPDARTAVIALTHDPKLDEPALAVALRAEPFYIGALGSRRTHGRRLERLRDEGFDDTQLARIRGPIGLDIGAVSPAEIAVSIAAEMTQTLRRPPQ